MLKMLCTGCSNKHGTERDDRYSTQNETGQNGRERKKLERNDPDEGPRSRTERKDKKKLELAQPNVFRSKMTFKNIPSSLRDYKKLFVYLPCNCGTTYRVSIFT